MPNTRIVFVVGESREGLARIIEQENQAAAGIVNKGQQQKFVSWDGDDWANDLSSAEATNGKAARLRSQNGTYRLEVENAGMGIYGAPTMDAFTEGSVLFVGASKVLSQDNTNLFWTDSTNTLKALNLIVPTKAAVGAAALGSEVLTVTGNARVSTFLGVGGAPSATIQLLVTGTANITGDFTVNTDKFVVTASSGNVAFPGNLTINTDKFVVTGSSGNLAINTDKFTVAGSSGNTLIAGTATINGNIVHDTTLLVTDVTNNKVGIGGVPVSTDPMFQVVGTIRSTGSTPPTTGTGIELVYNPSISTGLINCRDAGAATFKDISIRGLSVDLNIAGTASKFKVDGTGIGFFATTPVAQQASPGQVDDTGVDATYSNTERDLLIALTAAVNAHTDALEAYGLEV
jgi:hypothetical protein